MQHIKALKFSAGYGKIKPSYNSYHIWLGKERYEQTVREDHSLILPTVP